MPRQTVVFHNAEAITQTFGSKVKCADKIALVVNLCDGYTTSHALFDQFRDVLTVLLVNRKTSTWLKGYQSNFDFIVFYDGPGYFQCPTGNVKWAEEMEGKDVHVIVEPAVHAAVVQVLEKWILPFKKDSATFHLTTTDEELIMELAYLSQKYGLDEMYPELARNFVSKVAMQDFFRKSHIPVPRGVEVRLDRTQDAESFVNQVMTQFGEPKPSFPLFVKPTAGSAAIGSRKLCDHGDLLRWFDDAKEEEFTLFIIQEFTCGQMYCPQMLIDRNGRAELTALCKVVNDWSDLVVKQIPAANVHLDQSAPEYTRIREFTVDVFLKMGAAQFPGAYVMEVIEETSTKELKIIEVMRRPFAGASENVIVEQTSGLDMEAAHLLAPFVTLEQMRTSEPRYRNVLNMWYPRTQGKVVRLNFPAKSAFDSGTLVLEVQHKCSEGEIIDRPWLVSDTCCEITAACPTQQSMWDTAVRLAKFRPIEIDPSFAFDASIYDAEDEQGAITEFQNGIKH